MAGGDGVQTSTIRMDPNITTRMLGLYGDAESYLNTNPFQPYPYQRVAYPQLGQIASRNYLGSMLGMGGFGFQAPQQYQFSSPSWQFGATDVVPYIPPGGEVPPGGTGDGTNGDGGPTDPDNPPENDPPEGGEIQWSPYGFPLGGVTFQDGTTTPTTTDTGSVAPPPLGGVTFQDGTTTPTTTDTGSVAPPPPSWLSGLMGYDLSRYPTAQTAASADVTGTPVSYSPLDPSFGSSYGPQLGEAETRYAAGVAGDITGYDPLQVSAMMSPAAQAGYAGDVGGGSYTSQRLGELRNIYEDQVVGSAISDLARARDIAGEMGPGSAQFGAYGGDRQAIREAELDRNYLDTVGRTTAQLRSEGFGQAADLMGRELGLGLQAGLANQATLQGLNQYNTAALNDMSRYNAGLGLQAGMANQQAGLGGANLNLEAAGMLSGLGGDLFGRGLQGVSALNQMGTQDQALAQAMIQANMNAYQQAMMGPLQGFGTLQGILSGIPVGYSQYGGTNPGAGIAGGALTGAGIGSTFGPWGAGIGALGGGLLGWLG